MESGCGSFRQLSCESGVLSDIETDFDRYTG